MGRRDLSWDMGKRYVRAARRAWTKSPPHVAIIPDRTAEPGRPRTDYNGPVNLKLTLLLRMTLIGLACWLGVSIYLVEQSGREAQRHLATVADQLEPMVAADVMRRLISTDLDPRQPDLSGMAARFPEPLCLRYRSEDASVWDWGCEPTPAADAAPRWISRLLTALGPGHISFQRQIRVYGRPAGVLTVEADDASLLRREWASVRQLLGLAAVTVLMLDILVFLVISRINRLAGRLAESHTARAELTVRLIRLQEDERRELAHELHEEFGQCVSALGALSASLRQSVAAGETLAESDLIPLETSVEHMLASLRGMLHRMSQPPLDRQGLRSAVADLVTAWRIEARDGARLILEADAATEGLPNDESSLCAYRIVQECLHNISRHAPHCKTARVGIRRESDTLHVRVSNDLEEGRSAPGPGVGMGLRLLNERVLSLGGFLSIDVSATEFAVRASLPVKTP